MKYQPKRKIPNGCPYCSEGETEMATDEYSKRTNYREEQRFCHGCGREWIERYKFLKWVEVPE